MFWITEDPSSGSLVQCLAKNYKNDSIVSIDMDKVSVMAAYSDPLCVSVVHWIYNGSEYDAITPNLCVCVCVVHCTYNELHTHTYTQQVRICCHNTDLVVCV